MKIGPEGLGVGEEGIEAGDGRGAPKVDGGPAVGLQLGRGLEGQRRRVQEGEEVGEEEAGVGCYLDIQRYTK